jgi:uncharacterized protein YggE
LDFIKRLILSLVLFSPGLLGAAGNSDKLLTLTVTAEAKSLPDLAELSLYFTAYNWNLEKSELKLEEQIRRFLEKISPAAGAELKTVLGPIQIKPSYQFNREVEGFVPSNFLIGREVNLSFGNPKLLIPILAAALKDNIFVIRQARFITSAPDDLSAQAFKEALEKGRAQALSWALASGTQLGELQSIEELESEILPVAVVESALGGISSAQLKALGQDSPLETAARPAAGFSPQEIVAKKKLRLTFTLR